MFSDQKFMTENTRDRRQQKLCVECIKRKSRQDQCECGGKKKKRTAIAIRSESGSKLSGQISNHGKQHFRKFVCSIIKAFEFFFINDCFLFQKIKNSCTFKSRTS